MKQFALLLCAFILSACSSIAPSCTPADTDHVVYVVGASWHTEIGIPTEQLGKNLQFYKDVFPGARVIMFGYGKRTFFTAKVTTPSEYILGPFPGPAVIHVVGLSVTPPEAYPEESMIKLTVLPEGQQALSDYIWGDLEKDMSGQPTEVALSTDPDGLFYAAQSEYNLLHTCNTWTAEALHVAGLPISSDDVVFESQVMFRASEAAESQCQLLR